MALSRASWFAAVCDIQAQKIEPSEHMGIRAWRKLPMPIDDSLAYFFGLIFEDWGIDKRKMLMLSGSYAID